MSEIILGEQQQEGLNCMIDFLNTKEVAFSLTGYAGCGKSLLIGYLVEHLEKIRKNYVLCAPTHKAKVVLERFTGKEGITIHKLLALAPNVDVLELDLRDLRFSMNSKNEDFPTNGVVICDESSMVNDDLFDLLIEYAEKCNTKVIFSGDIAQISPVNNTTCEITGDSTSKVFSLKTGFNLTKIYRQLGDSGLVNILPILRKDIVKEFETTMGSDGSLICYNNTKDFFMEAIPCFKKAIVDKDIMGTKFLSYTNKRVDALNAKMKEALFGLENQYNEHEFITACTNIDFDGSKFWNSMDYIVDKKPIKKDIVIPGFASLPGYELSLYDSADKISSTILILDKDIENKYFVSLAAALEELRISAIEAKKRKDYWRSKKNWKSYYEMMGSFTTPVDLMYDGRIIRKKSFDLGYATTSHKSQGSSIDNVFIDMQSINRCYDKLVKRQLQYVSVSRTRKDVHILQ